ncbi:MAG: methyltransferase [bacterium]|nr:methyltransferase [bacterium]
MKKDYFYKGKVTVFQEEKGYRFSIDAPILADFLPVLPDQTALEIGAGSAIVSLLALYKKKFAAITGIEIQTALSRLASQNAEANGFLNNLTIVPADFNDVYGDYSGIRHIFSNPPYNEIHRGRLSPNPQIRDAKSETKLTLNQLLTKSYGILGSGGNLYLVLPYDRYAETIKIAETTGYAISRLREVFSFKDGKPGRFLVQLTNYNVSLQKMPPLIIFKEKGVYTAEMDRILTG